MDRVHNLSGAWFTVAPSTRYTAMQTTAPDEDLPIVNDILASTYTCTNVSDTIKPGDHGNNHGVFGQSVCPVCFGNDIWSDTPFLRVTEVLLIVEYDQNQSLKKDHGRHVATSVISGDRVFWLVENANMIEVIDLPDDEPGNWAVRVEAHNTADSGKQLSELIKIRSSLPPTDRPLNQQETNI